MFRPPSLLSPRSFLPLRILLQGSRGFYVRAYRALLPPHAPDMLTVRIQVIDGTGTFTQSDSQPCRLLTSLHGHYPTSPLLRSSPPLSDASVLSASRGHRLCLVWASVKRVSERFLFLAFFIGFFVRPGNHRFFARPRSIAKPARAGGCQGWSAHQPFHVLWP